MLNVVLLVLNYSWTCRLLFGRLLYSLSFPKVSVDMRYASWQSATCENVARENYRHSEISVQSLGKGSPSRQYRAVSTLTYFSLVMCQQHACKMPLAASSRIGSTRLPVVTLDRLFVSRHVKTWNNRVGYCEFIPCEKRADILRINLSFLAQLLGHVLENIFHCARRISF